METNYEVYVQKKGDPRWNLEAQYGDGEKSRAVEDAKRLERTESVDAVRVIRENYHPDTNVTKEFIVYTTKKEAKGNSRPSPANDPGGRNDYGRGPNNFDDDDDDYDDDDTGGSRAKKVFGSLFRRKSKDTEESDDDAPVTATAVAGNSVPAPAPRGMSVLLKFIIILAVSALFAAVVTGGYISIMIR